MLLTAAQPAMASCNANSCSNSLITYMYVKKSTGHVFLKLDDNVGALDCTLASGEYVTLEYGANGTDEVYASLLAAFTLGKPVKAILIINTSSGCDIDYIFT